MKILTDEKSAGKRIDKVLSSYAKVTADKKEGVFFNGGISRVEIADYIKEGKVLVNGKTIKPSYILKEGDQIEITFDLEKNVIVSPNPNLKIRIIHEDDDIIIIDKPAGIRSHVDLQDQENTLVNFLVARYPEIASIHDGSEGSWMRPGIVHRLDMDTSGIMVVARNEKTLRELKRKFQDKEIEKKYWALAIGRFEEKEGIIEKPLARSSSYRKQVIATKRTKTKIREAITHYKVIQEFDGYALLEVSPKTGRMHQIRVHLASIGHPIIGDEKYLPKNMESGISRAASRHLLHAKSIRFSLFGRDYFFDSAISDDFRVFLD
ncbi:MAG: RluA family pseudouridine synthase [Candidatus Moranbacteria bacterium]|nr:RluA family pseudouridine synthase [Candidatus Moranbacteria bacterium]